MRYATAGALRAALGQRLLRQANETNTDIARLRRRVVFERLLVRFAHADAVRWVLKGGAAVEVRLTDRARATKDLDMALADMAADENQVKAVLVDGLMSDPQGDLFEFRLGRFRTMSIDGALGPGWRASVECQLDGRTFDHVVIDIVVRPSEVERLEPIRLPGTLSFASLPTVEILAVDLNQHFAEKLHAMVRVYDDRPSSRVKDLADVILFIDTGLEPSLELAEAVAEVFAARGAIPPGSIPDPPASWRPRYAELADDLQLSSQDVDAAMTALRAFWTRAAQATRDR